MRQTLLMLVIAIASPLAMAQDAGGVATASVIGADASQHHAAATSQDRGNPTRKPTSAIGRALAELLQDANRPAAQAMRPHTDSTTTEAVAPSDIDAAHRTELAAQTEPGSAP